MRYEVYFCKCGRVHFVPEEKITDAIDENKQVLVVCNHCGDSFVVGADETRNEKGEKCYDMYSFDKKDTIMEDTSRVHSIVFTSGEKIMMTTGGEATYYGASMFIDWETPKPDGVTSEEWEDRRRTVHTKHTINCMRDEDKLEQLSHYHSNIDWKGTKFEKAWS